MAFPAGNDDAVASEPLGFVEREVGMMQGGLDRAVSGVGEADAYGDPDECPVRQADVVPGEVLAEAFEQRVRLLHRAFWEEEGELFAAVAADQVGLAHSLAEQVGDSTQHDVAGAAAMAGRATRQNSPMRLGRRRRRVMAGKYSRTTL